nr:hypothetical protein [Tanacetum cinerariifolium]
MNQNFYNSNSSGFDQSQPPQFPVIPRPPHETSVEILHDQKNTINSVQTFLRKFNRYSFFEMPKELTEYINTLSWNHPAFYNNDEDDKEDYTISSKPDFLITDSLIMGDEHLNTILEKESGKFIKYSVENLFQNPSESDDECESDVLDCDVSQTTNFLTFSNPLFDDSTFSDDESSHEEVIHEMNLDSTPKNDRFDTKSYLLESLLNRDTLMAFSPKIYYLLDEFVGELIFLKSIPPGIDEADYEPEEDIHFFERFLYDNSSPHTPKEFCFENSDATIESFSPSPILVEDSDPFMEEINLFLAFDGSIPPGIDNDYSDSKGDNLFLERLLHNDHIPLPNTLDFSNVIRVFHPFFTYPDRVSKIKDAFGNKKYKPEDIQELLRKLFNDVQNIHEELTKYINTSSWKRPAFYNNDEDDDEDYTISITPDFLITNFLIMGDEHLSTIPKNESDKFIKSSVENLVPNPSESEDECESDVLDCDDSQTKKFSTFSNPLFDDSTFSDDESSHEEVIHEMNFKTYSNPLFDHDEEIISSEFNSIHNEDLDSTPKNNRFYTKSYLLESLLNRDTLMASSPKIDYLLDEFAEFCSENSDATIESFSPSPIPFEDSEPFMEEIDLFLASDGSIPPGIDNDYSDSEWDNLFLERLLLDDHIPLLDTLDFLNVIRVFLPFFTYPVTSSVLFSSGSEDTIFDPDISNYHFSYFEPGVSHRSGTFMKFNVYPNYLNESSTKILSSTCFPMDQ